MQLLINAYAHQDGVVAGSIEGQKAFRDLLQKTTVPVTPEVCFLDFAGITVATTSFLRDSVVAYRNHARSAWPRIYPVGANLAPRVREELASFLSARNDAFVICTLNADKSVSNVELIGQVDGKQGAALRAVLDLGEADAPGIREHVSEEVAPTAWNNRLGALVAKGILMEVSGGRNKKYRPVLEGLRYGS